MIFLKSEDLKKLHSQSRAEVNKIYYTIDDNKNKRIFIGSKEGRLIEINEKNEIINNILDLKLTGVVPGNFEDISNKSLNIISDSSSNIKYPSVKAVFDWATNLFTTVSDVTSIIIAALSGYATQTWVTAQGYITNVISSLGYTPLNPANNLSDVSNASTSRTNLGATTVGNNLFTLANPSAVRWIRINADNTVTTRTAAETLSDIGAQAAGTYLITSNNLSDITNAATARNNLGLGNGTYAIVQSGASIASTNTTAEEVIASVLIPAGTLGNNDMLEIYSLWDISGRSGTVGIRTRLHTSAAVGGTIYAARTGLAIGSSNAVQRVQIGMGNASNLQIGQPTNNISYVGESTGTIITSSISTASNMYVVFTSQKTTGTDPTSLRFYSVKIVKI